MFKSIAIVLSMLVVGASSGLALRPSVEVAVANSAVTCPCGECESGCDCCNDGDCTCQACVCDVCDSGTCEATTECCAGDLACPAGECDASLKCGGSGCDH